MRAELQARLLESEQKLHDIDAKMDEMARRQRERMKADTRVDETIMENLKATTEEKKKTLANSSSNPNRSSDTAPKKGSDGSERVQMITRELTSDDITVKPKEDDSQIDH